MKLRRGLSISVNETSKHEASSIIWSCQAAGSCTYLLYCILLRRHWLKPEFKLNVWQLPIFGLRWDKIKCNWEKLATINWHDQRSHHVLLCIKLAVCKKQVRNFRLLLKLCSLRRLQYLVTWNTRYVQQFGVQAGAHPESVKGEVYFSKTKRYSIVVNLFQSLMKMHSIVVK